MTVPDNKLDYITLAEAASRTGKSEMTIRRLSKKNSAVGHVKHENGTLLISSEFVSRVYPFDYKGVNSVNLNDNQNVNNDNKTVKEGDKDFSIDLFNKTAILQVKVEEKDKLITIQQQQIERLEKQFEEYRQEKQKEIERLHDKWSQEQEIFKRDQQLNAGKLLTQHVQEQPEEVKATKKKWWQF